MCNCLHVKYLLFLSDFNETWIFLNIFLKNNHILNFANIRSVATELFHADGWTDGRTDGDTERHDSANSRFLHFFERAWKLHKVPPFPRNKVTLYSVVCSAGLRAVRRLSTAVISS